MKFHENQSKFNEIWWTFDEKLPFLKNVLDLDEKYTILEQIFSGIWWYQWKITKFSTKGLNEENFFVINLIKKN